MTEFTKGEQNVHSFFYAVDSGWVGNFKQLIIVWRIEYYENHAALKDMNT